MKTITTVTINTITILTAAVIASSAARADTLEEIFAQIARQQRQQVPRYHPLPDGASSQQLRTLRRDVGQLLRILRGYSFLSHADADWARQQMAQKISLFKEVAAGIEQRHDLHGRNWVAGSERSRWQFLCRAITEANWQITNPSAGPQVTQEQKVRTASEALSRGLQMIRHAELRPYADQPRIDAVVNRVLWARVAPPPRPARPGPRVVVVDASSRVTNVDRRVTVNVNQRVKNVTRQQLIAPTTVFAPRNLAMQQNVNAAPGSVVSAGQGRLAHHEPQPVASGRVR